MAPLLPRRLRMERDGMPFGVRSFAQDSLLAAASEKLAESLDVEEVSSILAAICVEHLAEMCAVHAFDAGGQLRARFEVATRDSGSVACGFEERIAPLVAEVLESGLPVIARQDEGTVLVVAPLVARGRCAGVLSLISRLRARSFDREDRALIEALARRGAVALDNARRYGEAIAASKMRDVLLGEVAHDLRNPIMVVDLVAQMMSNDISAPRIRRAVRRMLRLVDDLVDVSRLDGEHPVLELERTPIEEIVKEAWEGARVAAPDREINVVIDVPHDGCDVVVDRQRILQVLANLLDNAIKFSPAAKAISIRAAVANDSTVELSVEDGGSGIPENDLTRIFDRFCHAQHSEGGGSGMGLAICKGWVEAHGGRIWAANRASGGAALRFTLPMAARLDDRHLCDAVA